MRQRKTVDVEGFGTVELIEPSFADAQKLYLAGGDTANFGIELLKLCVYKDKERIFESPELSMSEGQKLLKLVPDVLEICGFTGKKS